MFPATDLDNHLAEVPARTGARTAAAKIDGDQSAEFQEPASYGLVRYINATFGQQVLDITKRQGEPSVKPDRVLDNLRRKPMSLEGYLDHPETVAAPDRFGHRLNVSMPIRAMIDRIEVHKGEERDKPEVILIGALSEILAFTQGNTTAAPNDDSGRVLMVAGARYQPFRTPVSAFVPTLG